MSRDNRGTITVQVRFFAYFRETFGGKERVLKMDGGTTVARLLESLGDDPARRAELFADDPALSAVLKPYVVVMINGANLAERGGLAAELHDGDQVAVFPLMGGG
ncbi:MAG: MoaD/ThiS family protein [Candidatus Aminicenantes bacterium]|nr:MoaD/ThiS family protein [Candidatus Aminicenantes bacterium]